jgi:phosphate transport system regulatory protein PhoU
MERIQRNFQERLDLLSEKILRLGGLVERAIGRSVRALVDRNSELAREVIQDDNEVDRLELEIDELCMELLALQQPMARDLRFITTAMKITPDLERIGDHATNISERALEINNEPPLAPLIDISAMAHRAQEMVRGALDALVRRDADAARAVIAMDDELDTRMVQVFRARGSEYHIQGPATELRREVLREDRRPGHQRLRADRLHDRRAGDQARRGVARREQRAVRMKRVLVIEDDPDIGLSVKYNLERDGDFEATVVRDGVEGIKETTRQPPDLILLDLNLPGLDGLEVCRRIRGDAATASIPIIMLTARVDESDTIRGLELGADDYVTKPFSVKELVARVRAVIRRSERPEKDADVLTADDLQVDLAGRRIHVGDTEVTLTRKEFDLLVDLMRNRGRVVTRQRLLERVWGYDHPGETRTVDVHVRQLRKKLGAAAGDRVETVVGVGYRFRGTS